ncbi:TetR/AcrR family transcriptional regulator [Gordonia sp. TBRC 11910]|uniref:TetR/AcrR family transcriptional regulator n=1 Tax=Gordonia asplenii TaxID=2725283 RepID=A0A848KYN4_9ACTN|nr:TetR/AcrR family transcriptional regulator [Gordonia asplenii]NMO01321.1 TetR/AcrR family transcriptional regulator [Gordonia asplenii]
MVTAAEQGRETRRRLMDAAVEVIAEEGWGAASTRSVALRAGLPPGLVHYHFPSVTDLLIDASLRLAQEEVAGVVRAAVSDTGAAGLATLLDALASYRADQAATTVFTEMLLAGTRHERMRAGLAEVLRESRTAIADWLRREGDVIDPEACAAVVLAAMDGLVLHQLIAPELRDLGLATPLRRLVGISQHPNGD